MRAPAAWHFLPARVPQASQPVPYSSRTRGSPAGLTRWGAAVGTSARSLRPPRPFLQLRSSTASSPSPVAVARLLPRRFTPGAGGGPPVLAVVLHDSQRQRSVHRWMMLAELNPTHTTCGGCAPSRPPALPRPLASTLLLTFNRLAFAGSVFISRGGSINQARWMVGVAIRGDAGRKGEAGRWASLPMRRKAMAMKLAAVRKPRAARLTCCRRPFMAST